jgi:hypothetical protein
MFAAAGTVRSIEMLRDDAFQAHVACDPEEHVADVDFLLDAFSYTALFKLGGKDAIDRIREQLSEGDFAHGERRCVSGRFVTPSLPEQEVPTPGRISSALLRRSAVDPPVGAGYATVLLTSFEPWRSSVGRAPLYPPSSGALAFPCRNRAHAPFDQTIFGPPLLGDYRYG